MEWVVIVTVLALIQYQVFGYQVGQMRVRHGVKVPAMSGAPEFERMNRVHYNTLEQLIVLLPLMWLFARRVDPVWAAGFGALFIVGRFIFRAAYLRDPASRSLGFMLSFIPSAVMAVWVLVVEVRDLI